MLLMSKHGMNFRNVTYSFLLMTMLTWSDVSQAGALNCLGRFLGKAKVESTDKSPNDLMTPRTRLAETYHDLTQVTFSEMFPESVTLSSDIQLAVLKDHEIKAFRNKFAALLDYYEKQDPTDIVAFRKWIYKKHRHPYPTLNPNVVETLYKKNGTTLELYMEQLFTEFLYERSQEPGSSISQLKDLLSEAVARHKKGLVARTLSNFGNVLKGSLIAGPLALIVTGTLSNVVNPIVEGMKQWGAQHTTTLAEYVQQLMNFVVADATTVKALHDTAKEVLEYDFDSLTQEEAKVAWKKFEDRYFQLLIKTSKVLPAHKAQGRYLFKDLVVFTPNAVANGLSTYDTQYWTHAGRIDYLQDRATTQKRELTNAEKKEIGVHQRQMEVAQARIAGALAAAKLMEFMFPEVSNNVLGEEADNLTDYYSRYMDSMRIGDYAGEYTEQIKTLLANLDPNFKELDVILKARKAKK